MQLVMAAVICVSLFWPGPLFTVGFVVGAAVVGYYWDKDERGCWDD